MTMETPLTCCATAADAKAELLAGLGADSFVDLSRTPCKAGVATNNHTHSQQFF